MARMARAQPDEKNLFREHRATRLRAGTRRLATTLALLGAVATPCARLTAQAPPAAPATQDTTILYRALDLESAGRNREAADLFRRGLHTTGAETALLGLERVYAELGISDSLLAPLDTLLAANPRETTYRAVQLRTLQGLGREIELRRAFEDWVKADPKAPAPYRTYARILLDRNQAAAADTVIGRARQSLGGSNGLYLEIAQLRAAQGQWVESAHAWRVALDSADYLQQAASYALAPAPTNVRPQIREIFLATPVDVPARRALAQLESVWGSPADGWAALRDLPVDSTSADAWAEFAQAAEAQERWSLARDAYEAALRWRPSAELAFHAATSALNSGDPAAAIRLAPLSLAPDSTTAARRFVPLHARALALQGRPAEAERLVARYDKWITPGEHEALTRTIAWGWVRCGDMSHARQALSAAGPAADSSDAAGWLALYDGDLRSARALLRAGTENTPELALALGLVARISADTAPGIGAAFLSLARGDTTGAAQKFADAADHTPSAASLLLLTAAQLRNARHDDTTAMSLWKRIVETWPKSPEAPQAELAWARALRGRGDDASAVAHLEHMILTYPESALLPQARRELELARKSVPELAR